MINYLCFGKVYNIRELPIGRSFKAVRPYIIVILFVLALVVFMPAILLTDMLL